MDAAESINITPRETETRGPAEGRSGIVAQRATLTPKSSELDLVARPETLYPTRAARYHIDSLLWTWMGSSLIERQPSAVRFIKREI